MLCSEMLMLIYHVWRRQMAKRLVGLVETGGNHDASVRSGLGHKSTLHDSNYRDSMARQRVALWLNSRCGRGRMSDAERRGNRQDVG